MSNKVNKLRLISIQGENYAKVAGEYSRSDEMVRDHNIWVTERESDNRIMFYSGSSWVVTSMQYKQTIMEGATGGFYNSRSKADEPYEADWSPNYKIVEVIGLILVQGENYAKVAGEYSRSDEMVRDHNIWVTERESDNRIMFYSGSSWVVTSMQYKQTIMEGATGGFYSSKSKADVPYEADWSPNYKIGEVSDLNDSQRESDRGL